MPPSQRNGYGHTRDFIYKSKAGTFDRDWQCIVLYLYEYRVVARVPDVYPSVVDLDLVWNDYESALYPFCLNSFNSLCRRFVEKHTYVFENFTPYFKLDIFSPMSSSKP